MSTCSHPGRGERQLGGTVPKLCQSNGAASGRTVCAGGPAGDSLPKGYGRGRLHRAGREPRLRGGGGGG